MTIRVILADDHPVILFGVRQMLSTSADISVVAEVSDPKTLMETLASVPCDVLVTDFSMPGTPGSDGLVMLNAIRNKFPKVRVIVLTMLENPGLLNGMCSSGALAVLHKRHKLTELPTAITTAYRLRRYPCSSAQRELCNCGIDSTVGKPISVLSPRELEVMRLLVGGMTVTGVALYLSRSIKTVSTQKHSAMKKLGMSSDSELFNYGLNYGLLG